MRIAYVNYGKQSGVTPNVTAALTTLGHRIVPVDPVTCKGENESARTENPEWNRG